MDPTIPNDSSDTLRGADMHDPIETLILDLLEWIGPGARPYSEAIEVWRTSCPRLPIWEDAFARGYLTRTHLPGSVAEVTLSDAGVAYLRASRGMPRAESPAVRPLA
ncbi:3-phosphoglycerate dehydrogenase [Paraburkholderia sediminicola]|uniref:3-phosphoglycerate dehydrogenase n=1 Tax=Paraburkholderia sediminicola TaxID=458836 RepID=UPI0038B70EB6